MSLDSSDIRILKNIENQLSEINFELKLMNRLKIADLGLTAEDLIVLDIAENHLNKYLEENKK